MKKNKFQNSSNSVPTKYSHFSLEKRVEIKYLQVESQREKERKWRREGEAKEEGFCQDFINTYVEWNNYARIKTEENFPELVLDEERERGERGLTNTWM